MPIFIGLLVLCGVFVFGSKTAEASGLYYDPPGAERHAADMAADSTSVMDDSTQPAAVEQVEDAPAAAAPEQDAAAIARSIYDGVDL